MARGKRNGPYRYEYELGKRDYTLKADVDEIILKSKKRMNAVMRESLQRTIDIAQTPTAKGGRMRVDTGFLRASGQSSLNGLPTGPTMKPKDAVANQFSPDAENVTVTLSQMKFGSTFFFGWTANYAKYREAYDAFLYGAIERWQHTVNDVVEEVRKRMK